MTISTISSTISYNGNGATTAFAFPYRFLANADLVVVLVAADGTETIQVITTNYTVTGAGDDAGGTVTMLVAPPTGSRLVIRRNTAITQETDYISGDPFPAETHERALDRLTIIAQEQQTQIDRSIQAPATDPTTIDMTLASATARANTFMYFDSNGEPAYAPFDSPGSPSVVTRQRFSGDDVTTVFTLAADPGASGASIMVYIGGVYQNINTYSVTGATLTFSEAPPAGTENIEVVAFTVTNIGETDAGQVSYTPAGTGAVATTVQTKLRETVSVKDFGTDTAAVQAAINSLGAGGGFVLVNRGVSYTFASLTVPDNVTLYDEANNRIVFHDCAIEDGSATNLLLRSPVAGATRVHIEPRGWVESGTATKLDWMHDPYQEDSTNYRIFNVYTLTGDPFSTGEGAICAINAKSTGNFWGNWPTIQFGFSDLGATGVCAKMWFGDHTATQHYTPMKGAWRQGKVVASGDYVTSSNRIYQAASSGTCGATIPSHTVGTVSDGGVDWTFIRSPNSASVRPTFMFGDRSQMPIFGYVNARVQFGTETVTHWGATHKFAQSSGASFAYIGGIKAAGSDANPEINILLDGAGKGYTRWHKTLNFVQHVGLGVCAATVVAADGATTPSVSGVETLKFSNTSATTVTALTSGAPGQRVRLVATNGNTTIQHTVGTSGGVIRTAKAANITLVLDGALDLERDANADYWRVVGVGY